MGRAGISDLSDRRREATRYGPPRATSAAWRGLSAFQWIAVVVASCATAMLWIRPDDTVPFVVAGVGAAFLAVCGWRVLLVAVSRSPAPPPPPPPDADGLPRYTILVALHDETEIMSQLVERLARIDYPPGRLQGLLVLEAHDHSTIAAALAAPRPEWLDVFVAPPGEPRTKPRALNCALPHVTGDLLTVYDAEDEPDPFQLREAAARFMADESGRLACLQAPLRIRRVRERSGSPFLDRQFAAEYASLFETALPGMARLGLPFPLGGTSNHFRVDVLRAVGGWDAFNVTEDADLGFRLWSQGWRLGVISRPTWETPPGTLADWLPQRTRWLKGYMQTWGVHTRRPWRLGVRGVFALTMTVGACLASASLNGPSLAWVAATVLTASMAGLSPETPTLALSVLVLGSASAWLSCAIGARRTGVPYGLTDMTAAPAYWALQSLAAAHAGWRLLREPFAWDKTRHRRDTPVPAPGAVAASNAVLDEMAENRLSAAHAAAPQPVA